MSELNIIIVDYGMGNLHSLKSTISFLGAKSHISNKENDLLKASHIFLPGVGSFKKAMEIIQEKKIDITLKKAVYEKKIKLFGICLGMQLMGSFSEEDNGSKGLNFVENVVTRFDDKSTKLKVPHVGFNKVTFKQRNESTIFDGLNNDSYFYFVHSFKMELSPVIENSAVSNYGKEFISAFHKDNMVGTQFHPELSQSNGLKIISNFLGH